MIEENLLRIKNELPSGVTLVAVSKFQPIENLMCAYNAGQRIFGENRPQEMALKIPQMSDQVLWHFIGHLQTNKLKQVVGKACLIHSIDSQHLLLKVNEMASQMGMVQDVLLQMHIAAEQTKQGFLEDELYEAAAQSLSNVRICGLMGMATFTDNQQQVSREFRFLRNCFDALKKGVFANQDYFAQCSMGMSEDYHLALEQGSTMVRIGSAIFPPRPQK